MQALAHFIFTHPAPISRSFSLSLHFRPSCDALHFAIFAFVSPILKPINCVQARPRQGVDCALWMKSCWHIFVQRTKGGNGIVRMCFLRGWQPVCTLKLLAFHRQHFGLHTLGNGHKSACQNRHVFFTTSSTSCCRHASGTYYSIF